MENPCANLLCKFAYEQSQRNDMIETLDSTGEKLTETLFARYNETVTKQANVSPTEFYWLNNETDEQGLSREIKNGTPIISINGNTVLSYIGDEKWTLLPPIEGFIGLLIDSVA